MTWEELMKLNGKIVVVRGIPMRAPAWGILLVEEDEEEVTFSHPGFLNGSVTKNRADLEDYLLVYEIWKKAA